jgi:hypothetical protein
MVDKILIGLGLIVLPFLTFQGQVDTREPKMMLMIVLLSALNLWAFFKGILKPVKNKWALIFLFYLSLHLIFAPKPLLIVNDCSISNFWLWKPLLIIWLSAISIFVISSIDFSFGGAITLLKIMAWCGFVMALYVILQRLGLDQLFVIKDTQGYSLPVNPGIGGTLGHPTVVGAFMAMIIPIALYLKKTIKATIIIIAIILTQSQMAIGAMVVSLGFMYAIRNKRTFILFLSLLFIAGLFIGINKQVQKRISFYSSGRLPVWNNIITDLKSPLNEKSKNIYPLSGIGLGSFKYVFHLKHPTQKDKFGKAHNEYLELLYNTGIIGLGLFLCAIWELVRRSFPFTDRYKQALMASFICSLILACGNFIWQLAPTAFYTIFIVGLLNNQSEGKDVGL